MELLNQVPFPSVITNENGEILSFNDLFRKQCNLHIGQKLSEFIAMIPYQTDENLLVGTINEEKCLFLKNKINDNQYLFIGTQTDGITNLLNRLKEIKSEKEQLQLIFDHSYDGLYLTNKNGVTIKTNAAIERITGIPKEYYIGKNVNNLMKRGILKKSVTIEALRKKETVSYVQKSYQGNITLLTGVPVLDQQGNIEMVVTNIRDLTDLNRIQAENSNYFQRDHLQQESEQRAPSKYEEEFGIIIQSESMTTIYETAKRIAKFDATILILGETGVGKDVLTNYIFQNSHRVKVGKLIKVNCGAIPPDLLESELFGYEAGAFTGANRQGKPGMFELANKGTIFLDEIGELPLNLQVKLLRILQEGEIQRVGATKPKKIDIHIIAATNRNLHDMVDRGEFREDLYYRLNVIPIHIPPLRERREDIVPLIHLFLKKYNQKYQLHKEFDYELIDFLTEYDWPGNIRELSNLIERLVVTTQQNRIFIHHLPNEYQSSIIGVHQRQSSLKEAVEQIEKKMLVNAAKKYQNTYEIAKALQTSQPTVVRKLKKYNIKVKSE